MLKTGVQPIVPVLLDRYGQLYSEAIGIDLRQGTAPALFQWLCASLLFSARIRSKTAEQAAQALLRQGWTTAEQMAASTWAERCRILDRSGYARYDESTSGKLGETSRMLLEWYQSDLGNLRKAAGQDPRDERRLLKEFKGIGDVGVDIFFREVQLVWDELYPFADRRALDAAAKLGLGDAAEALARRVEPDALPRLGAALVRVKLGGYAEEVLSEAAKL